jgi:hypothetical protein
MRFKRSEITAKPPRDVHRPYDRRCPTLLLKQTFPYGHCLIQKMPGLAWTSMTGWLQR